MTAELDASPINPIEEGRAKANAFNGPAGDGFKNDGLLNAYTCRDASLAATGGGCGRTTVTIDREPGVTPFLTACPSCGGCAQSWGYRGIIPGMEPTHEWIRPDTLDGLNKRTIEHIANGGLILRPIEKPEDDGKAIAIEVELMRAKVAAAQAQLASAGTIAFRAETRNCHSDEQDHHLVALYWETDDDDGDEIVAERDTLAEAEAFAALLNACAIGRLVGLS